MPDYHCERYYQVQADSPLAAVRAVNEPEIFGSGCVKVKSTVAEANYGRNPFRWLFNWPKYYEVTVTFTIQPEASDVPEDSARHG